MNTLGKSCRRYFSNNFKVPEHKIVIDKTSYRMAHPVWSLKDAENCPVLHHKPEGIRDWLAFSMMKCLRVSFDLFSGYKPGQMTENLYLRRIIFLETVAGVPGMIGGMLRHLKSLGTLQRDGGWIHHLLEEAENERMHLFTFLSQRQPGIMFRIAILGAQAVFLTYFTSMYVLSSRTAHRFVGYLEEEAVKTYTVCLNDLDAGRLKKWENMKAPEDAIKYWHLPENAMMRDVIVAVRADEAMHREVNHHLANLHPDDQVDQHILNITEGKTWGNIEQPKEKQKEQENKSH